MREKASPIVKGVEDKFCYAITEDCIGCGRCAANCLVGVIVPAGAPAARAGRPTGGNCRQQKRRGRGHAFFVLFRRVRAHSSPQTFERVTVIT